MDKNEKFIIYLSKLQVTELLGVARILNISPLNSDKTPRTGEQIISDIILKYCDLPRNARRKLYSIVKAAAK